MNFEIPIYSTIRYSFDYLVNFVSHSCAASISISDYIVTFVENVYIY